MREPAYDPMNGWAQLVVGVLGVVGGILTTWLVVRRAGKRDHIDTTQQLIDQLQEERTAAEARHRQDVDKLEGRYLRELVEVRQELAAVHDRVARMEGREMVLLDHVHELRHHIDQDKGPPPPPWPQALIHRA